MGEEVEGTAATTTKAGERVDAREGTGKGARGTTKKMRVEDFEPLKLIGRGAFGEVRLVRLKTTGEIFAMKKLKKSEMVRRGQVDHVKAERNLLAEVNPR